MKKWATMSYEDKDRNIRQCAEAGYGWGFITDDYKMDWLENLRTGYENDPDWFDFEIEDDDWDNVFEVFAEELASEIDSNDFDFDVDDFEAKAKETVWSIAAKYIVDYHKEGLSYTCEDVVFAINDLYTKL